MSLFDDASLAMIPSAYKDGKLYSIKPTDGSGDFTFTRGSNLAATRVDENGLIEKGRENLLLQSNQFDTTWGSIGASVTSGQSGYDGSNDAWLLENTVSFSYIRQDNTTSGVLTASIYAKSGNVNYMRFAASNSPIVSIYFDLVNGVGYGASNLISHDIEDVGNEWHRYSVSFLASSMSGMQWYPADGAYDLGEAGDNIYIQDAQLEVGLVATDYIETTTTTAQAGILEDMPRLDYSGGASCPSLLLEPQRSNLIDYSEYFYGSSWSLGPTTIVPIISPSLSPEGKLNAYRITRNDGLGQLQLGSISSVTAGVTYTSSFYVKRVSGSATCILFDLNNSSVIKDITDEWTRIDVTSTANNTTGRLYIRPAADGDVIDVYGAQLEQGSLTSYIPTYGTSQTRSGDNLADLTLSYGSQFSALFDLNGLGGSISNNFIIQLGSTNPIYLSVRKSDKKLQFYSPVVNTGYFATTATQKIAISCDGTNWTWSSDGQSGSLTATGTTNAEYIRIATNGYAGGGSPAALVKQIVLFETALTADELNSLTTL